MPLSEEELRLLEQMERALVEEDPKLASTMRGTTLRQTARRRALLAGIGFLAGVAVLMTGAVMTKTWLGIAGFVVMLLSATIVVTSLRGRGATDTRTGRPSRGLTVIDGGRGRRRPSRTASGTFMDRMEQRWRRRRDDSG